MLTPGLGDYGLGLIVRGAPPHRRFQHGGVNDGFVSLMIAFENGDGAVIMTNEPAAAQLRKRSCPVSPPNIICPMARPKFTQRPKSSRNCWIHLSGPNH